jgi:non-specific serine/threonine protein kinase
LHYIAHLLRHPGQEFHVCDLLAVVGEPRPCGALGEQPSLRATDLRDAGPLLDAKAKAAYKSRLDTLREELEETERLNDLGRSARVRDEIEAVTSELSAAIGFGGRDRHAASNAERARLGVTKRIRAAVEKIQQVNPALARHLGAAITTGYFCVYAPLATGATSWFLG